MDCCQPCIPGASGFLPDLFQVFQEGAKKRWIKIFDRQFGWYFTESLFCKLQKQSEEIPLELVAATQPDAVPYMRIVTTPREEMPQQNSLEKRIVQFLKESNVPCTTDL
jgi:hypothetical protein